MMKTLDHKVLTCSFTESFLDYLIRYIDENYVQTGQDLSRLAIVFGGKRPSLFLKRALAAKLKRSFYPPKFFTIDEFMTQVVKKHESFSPTQDLDSCYLLFQLAKRDCPQILKGRELFAQFLPWAREILAFIDQLDLENIHSDKLRNIEANAEIGYEIPEDINRVLEHIIVLREGYHQALMKSKTYSRGLQYYRAAQVIDKVQWPEFDQVLFCNFFYFNRSEEAVIKELYRQNKLTMIFQGDERKWPILKRIGSMFETNIVEGPKPFTPQFQLQLYRGFDVHSQVGIVREILAKVKHLEKTVIVLPNTDHLIPLISEVSQLTQDFNISMGYPLKRSSLYTLFSFIFKAQLSRKHQRYYTKSYLNVLQHPFVKNLRLTDDETVTRVMVHQIEEILSGKHLAEISGNLFISLDDIYRCQEIIELTQSVLAKLNIKIDRDQLRTILTDLHQLLFKEWESIHSFEKFAHVIRAFLDPIVKKSSLQNYPLNLNIANKMFIICDELKATAFSKEIFEQDDIFRIFDNNISREMVAFHGSPLKGLQILGLFETRSLNFENVIVIDVNEGALPSLNIYDPLIPRDVMISLNLDRLELEEEIQRYQFMRLISSAKEVHLVYQESKDKERSRFLEELVWEQQKKADLEVPLNRVVPAIRGAFEVKVSRPQHTVKKTPAMIEMLKKHTFSASSINMYLRNPMDFYYNYVLGLREDEDLLDEPEGRQVGTFIHGLLEEVFRPFVHKKPLVDAAFRKRFMELFETHFRQSFGRSLRGDEFLLKAILTERLTRFLDNEAHNPSRQVKEILFLEHRFEETINLSCGNVRFSYIVDRVDRMDDGTIMIIDYKTGGIDQMPKGVGVVDSIDFSREEIRDTIRSFQIPLYFHYLDGRFPDEPINAALYNLRTLELFKFIDEKNNYPREQIKKIFLDALEFVLSEIFNPEVDFVEDVVKLGR